jgi:hypothetical protein
MRRLVWPVVVAGVSSVVLACGVAMAADPPVTALTSDEVMAVTIPFRFVVDQRTMPPGRYDIGPLGYDGDRVAIVGTGDQGVLVAPDRERWADPATTKPTVIFDKVGGMYHLSKARFPGLDGFTLRIAGAM